MTAEPIAPVGRGIVFALLGPYRVFRGRRALAFLVAGQALSSLADWLLAIALTVLAYTASHSATLVALLTLTRLLPYVLVLPLAGTILDRWDRRRLMVGVGVGRALCMLGLLLLQSPATLPLVFPLAFLSASLSTLLRPTVNAILPTVVAAEDILPANGLLSQLDSLSHMAGPALGGLLVVLRALPLAFLLTGVAFALSAAAFFCVRLPARAAPTRPQAEGTLGEVVAGFRFLFRENEGVLLALTLTVAGLTMLGGAYYALAAVLTQKTFHLGSQGIGFLEAVYGVGGFLGGLLVGLVTRGRRVTHLFMAGAALSSLAAALFGLSPAGVWPFLCIAVVGMADIVVQVSGTTVLQAATPRELLGRAFSAFEATLVCSMLLGAVAAGPLLGLLGPRGATVAFAALGGAVLLVCLPRLRKMEDVLGVRIFLRGVPMLAPLSRHMLDDVAARLQREQVPAQTVIVREGEPGDRLYIVHSGEVEVVGRDPRGREVTIATQGKATYFGEIALLRDVPRTATVRARGPVTLYSLSRADFQDLLRRAHEVQDMMASTAAERYARYGQERLPMRL